MKNKELKQEIESNTTNEVWDSKPATHSFCETPEEKCTMNYCDENGCMNRNRILAEPKEETQGYICPQKKINVMMNVA